MLLLPVTLSVHSNMMLFSRTQHTRVNRVNKYPPSLRPNTFVCLHESYKKTEPNDVVIFMTNQHQANVCTAGSARTTTCATCCFAIITVRNTTHLCFDPVFGIVRPEALFHQRIGQEIWLSILRRKCVCLRHNSHICLDTALQLSHSCC